VFHIDLHKFLNSLVYNPKDPLLFNSGFFLCFFFAFLFFYQFVYKRKLTRVFLLQSLWVLLPVHPHFGCG